MKKAELRANDPPDELHAITKQLQEDVAFHKRWNRLDRQLDRMDHSIDRLDRTLVYFDETNKRMDQLLKKLERLPSRTRT